MHRYAVAAIHVILQYIIFIGDIQADVFRQLVGLVVAACQRIQVEGGTLYGDNLSHVLQFVQVGELQLVVITCQSLQVGAMSQTGGMHVIFDAAAYLGQRAACAVVLDTGIGVIRIDGES